MTEKTTEKKSVPVTEKVCGKCKRKLPASDFWKMKNSKDGLQPQCKDCQMGREPGTAKPKKEKVVKAKIVSTKKVVKPKAAKKIEPVSTEPVVT